MCRCDLCRVCHLPRLVNHVEGALSQGELATIGIRILVYIFREALTASVMQQFTLDFAFAKESFRIT